MSFGIGDANKRPGIFESFRSAMAPRELPPDDGLPLKPPPAVKAATIIAMLAGLALVIFGAFLVVAIDGQRFLGAVRDTVLVLPMKSVTVAFDADNPGHWAFHCHNLYHMGAGMMTTVQYEGV